MKYYRLLFFLFLQIFVNSACNIGQYNDCIDIWGYISCICASCLPCPSNTILVVPCTGNGKSSIGRTCSTPTTVPSTIKSSSSTSTPTTFTSTRSTSFTSTLTTSSTSTRSTSFTSTRSTSSTSSSTLTKTVLLTGQINTFPTENIISTNSQINTLPTENTLASTSQINTVSEENAISTTSQINTLPTENAISTTSQINTVSEENTISNSDFFEPILNSVDQLNFFEPENSTNVETSTYLSTIAPISTSDLNFSMPVSASQKTAFELNLIIIVTAIVGTIFLGIFICWIHKCLTKKKQIIKDLPFELDQPMTENTFQTVFTIPEETTDEVHTPTIKEPIYEVPSTLLYLDPEPLEKFDDVYMEAPLTILQNSLYEA